MSRDSRECRNKSTVIVKTVVYNLPKDFLGKVIIDASLISWDGEANATRLRESRILTGVVAVAQFLHRNSCKVAFHMSESDVIFNVMIATCASDEGYGRALCDTACETYKQ